MDGNSDYFISASLEHQKREKSKARELRQSQWWKNQLGRGQCTYCQEHFPPKELTMDHMVPIVRGGSSTRQNCVPACKSCNTKKGYKTTAEMALANLALAKPSENE